MSITAEKAKSDVSEIAPVLRSSESLGYILKAENTDHAKDLYLRL